jgi:hypothetical protein
VQPRKIGSNLSRGEPADLADKIENQVGRPDAGKASAKCFEAKNPGQFSISSKNEARQPLAKMVRSTIECGIPSRRSTPGEWKL